MTRSRPGTVLRTALWFALLAGVVEGLLVLLPPVSAYLLRQFAWVGPHRGWMPVAVNVVLALVVALLVLALRRLLPARWGTGVEVGLPALLGAYGVVSLYGQLHPAALLALAAGIAVQVVRLAGRDREGFDRLVGRTLLPLLSVAALLVAAPWALDRLHERRAMAALPAAPTDRPNVLLIVLDTVRDFSMSLYGYHRPTTPALAAWAAGGVTFDRAMATAPWTTPSHATMFTGRYPFEMTVSFKAPLDGTHPVIAEVLGREGYRTGGFVGNVPYASRTRGLARGFARFRDFPVTPEQALLHSALGRMTMMKLLMPILRRVGYQDHAGRTDAPEVSRQFLGWLDASDRGRPFFAFLNYYDAHHPYTPPEPYASRFRDPAMPPYTSKEVNDPRVKFSPGELAAAQAAYDAGINYLDDEVTRLLDSLQARGLLEHTVVILTSDHGEQFGEGGITGHGNSAHVSLLQVPMVIVAPGRVPAGRRIEAITTIRDLPATILDLTGSPHPAALPGRSLRAFWDPAAAAQPASPVYAELRRPGKYWQAYFADEYQFTTTHKHERALYQLASDPTGTTSLLPGADSIATRLEAEMDRLAGTISGMTGGE